MKYLVSKVKAMTSAKSSGRMASYDMDDIICYQQQHIFKPQTLFWGNNVTLHENIPYEQMRMDISHV
jgi:hypothetical protein